jgi:ATP-dependent helicase/DNAse subunit B
VQRCTAPLDLADLRLQDVVKWHAGGRKLVHNSLADRTDLSIGRALRAAGARRSRQFTEFDGNLGAVARASRLVGRPFAVDGGASSATSLERWAGCPFLYLMVNVLRVEATERPEDEWTVTALDKGSLVHAVLEQFFRERFEQQRSGPFTTSDHDRLEQLAWTHLRDLEDQGRTGHPLAWDNARAVIVKDLHVLLEREDTWRTEDDLEPALFERTFGDSRDPDTWPAVVVPLENGVEVRFRGAMDRVDFSPTGASRRALVIDYKTGSAWGYEGLAEDPVSAGRHVQLALYARALRFGLTNEQELDEIRAEYRFVSSKGGFERRQIVVDSRADTRLVEVVQQAANGIRDGVFLPRPGERSRGSFENCRFCEYDRICSTTRDEAWQRKRSNASFVPLERLQ